MRSLQIALVFGLCDGCAPLVALAVGQSLISSISRWTEYLGPLLLVGYGLSLIYGVWRSAEAEQDVDGRWMVFGCPLVLSLDNLVAGLGLGMLGFPILLSALVIGIISGLMSLAGLILGTLIERHLPIRPELLGSGALILVAVALMLDVG
jgi:manganese efflux pump family protein